MCPDPSPAAPLSPQKSPQKAQRIRSTGRVFSGVFSGTLVLVLFLLGLISLIPACTAEGYAREADDEVYGILKNKEERALGKPSALSSEFRVEMAKDNLRRRLLERIAGGERPKLTIDLAQALGIAAENSEEFQGQKERLYNAALSLTGQRNRYSTIFSGGGDAGASGVGREGNAEGNARGRASASKILASGASVLTSFVSNFFRVFTSGGGWNASSLLSLSITQPLLQGFGSSVTLEPLTQSERDVVYAIRDYEGFRRQFCVDIITSYLGVIESRNNLANQVANTKSLVENRKRSELMGQAGRLPQFQVDQALQQELSARDREISSRTRLATTVDRFKITLGMPIEIELDLKAGAIKEMQELGVGDIDLTEAEAIRTALENRLDIKNSEGRVEDAERQVLVAKDALKFGLDLSAAVDVPNERPGKAGKLNWHRFQWEVGLDLSLPFNKTNERNVYRRSLISYDAEVRQHSRFLDSVKQGLRTALRDLDQARRSYDIQQNSVTLAEQRVDSTKLLIDAGRAETRDFLDAQNSLLSAQNQLTSTLVDYITARLRLLRDLELLDVGTKGLSVDFAAVSKWKRSAKAEGDRNAPIKAASEAEKGTGGDPRPGNTETNKKDGKDQA